MRRYAALLLASAASAGGTNKLKYLSYYTCAAAPPCRLRCAVSSLLLPRARPEGEGSAPSAFRAVEGSAPPSGGPPREQGRRPAAPSLRRSSKRRPLLLPERAVVEAGCSALLFPMDAC